MILSEERNLPDIYPDAIRINVNNWCIPTKETKILCIY
jgi:hypothetical protein